MRAEVLPDPALRKHAGRFVWLAMETDKAENARFFEMYPAKELPVLLVIDPASERAIARWSGTATVAQLDAFLDDAARARAGRAPADDELERADALAGGGAWTAAVPAYRRALQRGGE